MIEIIKCSNCQAEDICKWCSEMERANIETKDITPEERTGCPITIKVGCSRYNQKARKQDGIFSNQQRQSVVKDVTYR